jgi:hypothetical protein
MKKKDNEVKVSRSKSVNEQEKYLAKTDENAKPRGHTKSVLTDIQFWVPVAVLLAGLLLLHALH